MGNKNISTKLNIEIVKEFSSNIGYLVLDNEYKNVHEKMSFKCVECGKVRHTSFDNLRAKQICKCKRITTPPTLVEKMNILGLISLDDIRYINSKKKIKLKDIEGYLYSLSTENLTTISRRNGVPAKFFNKNPYTYDNINNYLKINKIDMCLIDSNPTKASIPILFKCTKHEKEFLRSWNSVYNGAFGCDICSGVKRYTYEDIVQYVESKGNKFLSDEYVGLHHDYRLRCSCGNEYTRRMDVFIHQGATICPKCNGITINTFETVSDELSKNNIVFLSENFKNIAENIRIKYSCGFETERTLDNIRKSNYECPHCNKKGYKRNTEKFYEEVKDLVGNEYVFEGEYTICDAKMDVTHTTCGYKYKVSPHKFINGGHRCPICNVSKAEQEINLFLLDNKINYIQQYAFNELRGLKDGLLRFDFAILDKENNISFLLEYDGEYHYQPIEGEDKLLVQQTHDKLKDDYCFNNNICLLRIPYWNKPTMIEIIKDKLKEEGIWQKEVKE